MLLNNMMINKILDTYTTMVQHLENTLSDTDTNNIQSMRLAIAEADLFCQSYLDFERSFREAIIQDSDRLEAVIDRFNYNVDGAVNGIALNRKLKDKTIDRHGEKGPAYKNIPLDDIKNLYLSGMTARDIANEYKVSYQTIVARLKSMGVFRDSRYK